MSSITVNIIFFVISLSAVCFGLFIIRYPLKTFEIQKKFYAMINWRIEPISLEKEIRNTKMMGIFLFVFVIVASLYVLLR